MLKFFKKISDYSYVLSFDIAKKVSGYSLYDIDNDCVVLAGIVDTSKHSEDFIWDYFYNQIIKIIDKCKELVGPENEAAIFVTKERLPSQNGRFSTIETLQGLAQAHAVFDLAVCHSCTEVYDYEGIHATSVKAYFKKLINCEKPQKEDIANYLQRLYPNFDFSKYPFDVTDSLGVTLTLLGKKWDSDIIEKVRELKKERKSAKTKAKITKLESEIEALEALKIR